VRHFRTMALVTACAALGLGQPKGKDEGIKVHGHWVVEIRNRDGSLASRHEFENALTTGASSGQSALAYLLSGAQSGAFTVFGVQNAGSVAGWSITFSCLANPATANGTPCTTYAWEGPQVTISCQNAANPPYCNPSLTMQASGSQVILQGTWTIPSSMQQTLPAVCLSSATTTLGLCTTVPPSQPTCNTYTFTSVATNLTINYGQTANITVNLGFS
jgi:hypothetical protein